jgi:Ser/Thr protein kinase RdoA (MazF antagonist)
MTTSPSMVAPDGRFTTDKLKAALAEICARTGLDASGATLLRFTNNAVYRLAGDQAVVRIVASRALRHRVGKVVQLATWFAECDAPTVRLLSGIEQPVYAGEHVATVWQVVPDNGEKPRGRDLGQLLRTVHHLPLPPFELPHWAPIDDVRKRVDDAEALDEDVRTFLLECCDRVSAQLAELPLALTRTLVHGDAHLGNVIPSPDGPVLCDFDSTCVGPPEWDLTPVAVGVGRFGEPDRTYREMTRAYGFDVRGWDGFEVLREVRELKLITSVLPITRSNPEVLPELLRRLDDFRRGDTNARWNRYT